MQNETQAAFGIRFTRFSQGIRKSLLITNQFLPFPAFLRHGSLLAAAVLFASLGSAQFSSGIQGTVADRSGAVVPGVMIRVTNLDTGVSREVSSSANGTYAVPSLSPGNYTVQALKEGFAGAKQESLVLPPDEVRKVDFNLEVGSVHDIVNVSGQVSVLQTETGNLVSTMNQATLAQLPVPNNNIFNLMVIQPGVTGRSMGVDNLTGRSGPSVNFAGARADSNSFSMDNMSVNSISRGGNAEVAPNVESVEQVAVQLSDATAAEGRNMGAHVNVISKAGTNQFHGSAWDYLQNNKLNARNFFSAATTPLHRNQFGYAFGGPILKNRTFFFTSYEGIRLTGETPVSSTVETKAFQQFVVQTRPNSIAAYLLSNFPPRAYATTNLRDLGSPLAGVAACGGCAQANQFSAAADGIADLGTAAWNQANKSTSDGFTLRVDHELRPGKDRMYGYYYHFTGVSQTQAIRDFERDNPIVGNFLNLNETHIFSPTLLNEFQAGMVRYIGTYTVPLHINVSPINITSLGSTFQDTSPYPGGFFPTEYIVKDSVSIVRGSHTIKAGAERRRQDNNLKHTASYIPNYTFANLLTFANDTALAESRTVNPLTGQPTITYASQRITEYGSYVSDDWKVRRDLTVNIGLRHEYFGPYTDAKNRLSNFLPGTGDYAQQIASGTAQVVPQSWNPNHLNFAPRFGAAWDIAGKGQNVVRMGYGISYDRLATVYPAGYRNNPPLIGVITAGTQFGTRFTYGLGDPKAEPSQYNPQGLGYPIDAAFAAGLNSQNGIIGQRLALIGVSQHLPQPYTQNWFLGYQRSLPGRIVVEANYMGSKGTHLVQISNINQFTGDLLNGGIFHGFNSSFSSINMAATNGNSSYHGGTFSVRKAMSHNLTFQAAYTVSKTIDTSEAEQGITAFADENNQRLDRALASFNVPQRLSLSGFYNVPVLRGCNAWYCRTLGGWDVSGYGVFEKGLPLDVFTSGVYPNGDYNADGTTYDRPNAPSTTIQTGGFKQQQYLSGIFTASQFGVPKLGTTGSLGRNAFQSPGFERIDMALTKTFTITERFKLRFRLQAFNAFNHTNLNAPSGNLTSSSFGKTTSAQIPRQLSLSLMLRF